MFFPPSESQVNQNMSALFPCIAVLALSLSGCDFFMDLDDLLYEGPLQPADMAQADGAGLLDQPVDLDMGPPSGKGLLLLVPHTTDTIVVDGKPDDAYQNSPEHAFSGEHKGSDNVVRVRALWNDQRLFVLYQFKDLSSFTNPKFGIYACDCLDIYFNTALSMIEGRQTSELTLQDIHVNVNVNRGAYFERGKAEAKEMDVTFAPDPEPTAGYAIEISIAWKEFADLPLPGRTYGAHFASADCDRKVPDISHQFSWDVTQKGNNRQPKTWGRIELTKK